MNNNENWRDLEYLRPKDIKKILNISLNYTYTIIHQLPIIKFGNSYRIPTKAFEQWLKDRERSARA